MACMSWNRNRTCLGLRWVGSAPLRRGVQREPVEASVEDEGLRRPTEGLPRVRILTTGELDIEAAAELTRLGSARWY